MAERIYPVEVKPPTKIRTWEGWPDDVGDVLWGWNHERPKSRLSFRQESVFKCPDCAEFCRQPCGAVLDGSPICDDCLIARARSSAASTPPESRIREQGESK